MFYVVKAVIINIIQKIILIEMNRMSLLDFNVEKSMFKSIICQKSHMVILDK